MNTNTNTNHNDAERERAIAKQAEAVRLATTESTMILTGGPGVGKTYTIQQILYNLEGAHIELSAPTGKAARRMSEACNGFPARTIHRLLEYSPIAGGFTRNRQHPIDADVVIIDESSMIDVHLMASLLAAVKPSTRLIFVGDRDQLPSVGPGNILKDMIASKKIPTIELNYIFRQDEHSWIPTNAQKINHGQSIFPLDPHANDFFVHLIEDVQDARRLIVSLVTKTIPEKTGAKADQIQLLCPQKKGPLGIDIGTEGTKSLNQEIQDILNPLKSQENPINGFRTGDKVINIRNNYDLEVMNGETGIIVALGPGKKIAVDYGDKICAHEGDNLEDLRLAYALTVHKSQGSEWPHVVVPLHSTNYRMLTRNLAYTAITRARATVNIICNEKGIAAAIKNCSPQNRNTHLANYLQQIEPSPSIEPLSMF